MSAPRPYAFDGDDNPPPPPALVIPVDVYDVNVLVYHDREPLAGWFDTFDAEGAAFVRESRASAVRVLLGSAAYVVVHFDEGEGAGSVAHELLHASFYVLQTVGVRVDEVNHEALAYLLGYLVDQYEQHLARLDAAEA